MEFYLVGSTGECRSRRPKAVHSLPGFMVLPASERRPVLSPRLRSSHTLSVPVSVPVPPIPHRVRGRQCSRVAHHHLAHHTHTHTRTHTHLFVIIHTPPFVIFPSFPAWAGRSEKTSGLGDGGGGGGQGITDLVAVTVMVRSLACYCFECLHGRRGGWLVGYTDPLTVLYYSER